MPPAAAGMTPAAAAGAVTAPGSTPPLDIQEELKAIRKTVNSLKKVAWMIEHGYFRFEGRRAAEL